jgi:hypothetical protein
MTVRLLLVAEFDDLSDIVAAQRRLDAFRESSLPYDNYNLSLYRANTADKELSPSLIKEGAETDGKAKCVICDKEFVVQDESQYCSDQCYIADSEGVSDDD